MTVEIVFEQAMKLTEAERKDLVRRLMPTLPSDASADSEAVGPAWHREILARLERYDRGETTAIPADHVFERLERRFPERPA
ncbi:MAG TPA: addiction module protein [Gemmataceae bacterium]|nr:addiction module protein [Gemmataceae bacterium]